ncbi:hypothetical protein SprV_0200945700 [Sparganum proliferum]
MSKFLESQQPNCNSTASDGTSSGDKSGEISFASRTCARSTGASSQPPAKRAKSFFQSVYTNEARFLPPSTEELPTPSVSHILFSEGIVRRELEALNESKSPGPDEIPPKLLKELASELSVPLSMLFQTSFDTGTLPIDWKLAHITPLYKGGSRASTTNYRPISLTCILCKVMERIMKNELIDFLEVHGLLSNCQHGFRKGRSCTTNLLRSLQSWTRALDDRHEVHIAFIDFQKAFDTVPHQRLLHKLKKIGIGGNFLKWIENFLLGRHQVVCIGQGKSDPAMVGSGVPQGSVLGPILFLIYVDDAARALDCEVAMFADDMKIWSVIRGPADEDILQVNLNRLEEWSSRWLLRFNVESVSNLRCSGFPVTYCLWVSSGCQFSKLHSLIYFSWPLWDMSAHEFLPPGHGQNQGYYDPNYMQFAQYSYQDPKGAHLPAFGAPTHPTTYFTPSMPPQGSMSTDFDFEDEPPLLEELGVNFNHILQKPAFSARRPETTVRGSTHSLRRGACKVIEILLPLALFCHFSPSSSSSSSSSSSVRGLRNCASLLLQVMSPRGDKRTTGTLIMAAKCALVTVREGFVSAV